MKIPETLIFISSENLKLRNYKISKINKKMNVMYLYRTKNSKINKSKFQITNLPVTNLINAA